MISLILALIVSQALIIQYAKELFFLFYSETLYEEKLKTGFDIQSNIETIYCTTIKEYIPTDVAPRMQLVTITNLTMSQYLNPDILFLLFNIFQPTRQLFDEFKKFVSLISLLI